MAVLIKRKKNLLPAQKFKNIAFTLIESRRQVWEVRPQPAGRIPSITVLGKLRFETEAKRYSITFR